MSVFFRSVASTILVVATWTSGSGALQAQDTPLFAATLETAATQIGERILQVVPDRGAIFVKPFDEVGGTNSGISKAISEFLESKQYRIVPAAPTEIRGEIFPINDQQKRISGWRAEVRVVTRNGRSRRFEVTVNNEAEGNAFAGVTGQVRSKPVVRPASLQQAPVLPLPVKQATIEQGWIRPSPNSAYAMRVLVKNSTGEFDVREPVIQDGVVLLRLEKGEIYAIDLWNSTQWDAAAKLYIDGLSRFSIATDKSLRGATDIVSRNSINNGIRTLKGWVNNKQDVFAFKVFGADDAPGEILRNIVKAESDDEIGTIAVTFQTAYSETDPNPPMEQETYTVSRTVNKTQTRNVNGKTQTFTTQSQVLSPQIRVGSGKGPVVGDSVQMVEREFGLLREVIRIHYHGTR